MLSFSSVAEALAGPIYHRPTGESFSFATRTSRTDQLQEIDPRDGRAKALRENTKQETERCSLFSVIIAQILDRSSSLDCCLQINCFSTLGGLYSIHSLCPDLPLKMEAVILLASCKAEHALWFLLHFIFLTLQNMPCRSIVYLKYLERSLQGYNRAE